MTFILSLVSFLAIVFGVVMLVFQSNEKSYKEREKIDKKSTLLPIATGLLLLVVVNSFTVIPTGYTGVRSIFGQISETTANTGFNFKIPFVEKITLVNNKQQNIEIDTTVWSESSEQTVVYYEGVIVTYQISAEKSSWIVANVTNYKSNLITSSIVSSAVKAASKTLSTEEVTDRNYIEPAAMESIQNSLDGVYGEGTVTINKVVISNADFEDNYNQAIASRQAAQIEYEQAQIENQQKIEAAEAAATVKTTEAQAEADATLIEAEATAEANRLLQDSLSSEVLTQYMLEKWDGALPKVTSDGDTMFDISSLIEGTGTTE